MEWVEPAGGVVCLPRIKASVDVDVHGFYRILNEKYKTFVGRGIGSSKIAARCASGTVGLSRPSCPKG